MKLAAGRWRMSGGLPPAKRVTIVWLYEAKGSWVNSMVTPGFCASNSAIRAFHQSEVPGSVACQDGISRTMSWAWTFVKTNVAARSGREDEAADGADGSHGCSKRSGRWGAGVGAAASIGPGGPPFPMAHVRDERCRGTAQVGVEGALRGVDVAGVERLEDRQRVRPPPAGPARTKSSRRRGRVRSAGGRGGRRTWRSAGGCPESWTSRWWKTEFLASWIVAAAAAYGASATVRSISCIRRRSVREVVGGGARAGALAGEHVRARVGRRASRRSRRA